MVGKRVDSVEFGDEECPSSEESECPKVCVLKRAGVMSRRVRDFDYKVFANWFSYKSLFLGYEES